MMKLNFNHPPLMTTEQTHIIRQTFELIAPMADSVAAVFYRRLFELDPGLRAMFPPTLVEQGRKLMQMLDAAIGMLDRPQQLISVLQSLGKRHAGYGVRDEHYDTVGEALLWTLERGLGAVFTSEVKAAWAALYGAVATTMKNAANAEPAELAEVTAR
jgi:hemoglobin-like flavoprotein